MIYILMIPLGMYFIYMVSFAKHNWKKKNRLAAVGILLLGIAAVAAPVFLLLSGEINV